MQEFNKIYSENHRNILGFINMKIHNLGVAEEITNDVFMKLYNNLHLFDETKASMRTWVYNIAKNAMIDHCRKESIRFSTCSLSNHDEDDNLSLIDVYELDHSPNPHTVMVGKEMMDEIQEVISSLDTKYHSVADLYFNGDLSYDEIAERLKLPLGTVKGQINRARKKLIDKLERV